MSYELRPLTLAEILDAAFRLVQTEWRTLVGLSLIMQAPLVMFALMLPRAFDPFARTFDLGDEITPALMTKWVGGFAGIGLVYFLLYPFVAAAVTASVGHFYLGRRFSLGAAARAGLRSVFRLIAAYLVWMLAYLGVIVVVGGLAALAFMVGGAAIGGLLENAGTLETAVAVALGAGVVAVAGFWALFAAVVSSLLAPIAVLESHGIMQTVNRAFTLGATSKWRLIGVVFTTGMVVGVPVFGAQLLIGAIPGLGLLVWAAFQAVGFAFTTAVMVVLYFDLRCRAENYDLELLAQQVEAGPGRGQR